MHFFFAAILCTAPEPLPRRWPKTNLQLCSKPTYSSPTLVSGVAKSGVAKSYFSPRKITLRYASRAVIANMAARLTVVFKLFRLISNARARISGQQHAIDRQAAGGHGRIGEVSGVIMDARPLPFLRTVRPSRLHRIHTSCQHEFNSPWRTGRVILLDEKKLGAAPLYRLRTKNGKNGSQRSAKSAKINLYNVPSVPGGSYETGASS